MLRLTSADVLERSQMKKITGGYGSGSCGYSYSSGGSTYYSCGVSKAEAQFMIQGTSNGRWCCQSCSYC